ncbi:MAG TPA: hypothetical protein VM940_15220 [Chthoniobacterales bacterium]|nr:hypothetical protein [Chthoniobacterales bacterium]
MLSSRIKPTPLSLGRLAVYLLVTLAAVGCQKKTGKLSPELQARFDKEGIVHRADDLTFRRTRAAGQRDSGWDEKRASIVVTAESVFLHENGNPLVEITPRSTGFYEVHRDHERLSLRAGSGKSAVSWSFRPPDEADRWAVDIRAVIKNAKAR